MSSLGLRFTIERGLLRLGPAWVLLAGAALGAVGEGVGGEGMGEGTSPLRVMVVVAVVALALVEPIWGGVWAQMMALARSFTGVGEGAGEGVGEGVGEGTSPLRVLRMARMPRMPYAKAGAPLARVWLWLAEDEAPAPAGLGLVATLLAMAGATAMMLLVEPAAGRVAAAASVVATALAVMGAVLQPAFPATARLLGVAVGVALPWLLGMGLWGWQAPPPFVWLLIGGFCLVAIVEEMGEGGEGRGEATSPLRVGGMGYVAVVGALVWAQQPLAAGATALIFAVASWRWLRGRAGAGARWHLLGLFVATIGLLSVFRPALG